MLVRIDVLLSGEMRPNHDGRLNARRTGARVYARARDGEQKLDVHGHLVVHNQVRLFIHHGHELVHVTLCDDQEQVEEATDLELARASFLDRIGEWKERIRPILRAGSFQARFGIVGRVRYDFHSALLTQLAEYTRKRVQVTNFENMQSEEKYFIMMFFRLCECKQN